MVSVAVGRVQWRSTKPSKFKKIINDINEINDKMAEFKKSQEDITILLDRTKDLPTINAAISNISNKLDNLEEKLKGEITRIDKKLIEVEKSQDFISKEYEKYRHISSNITTKSVLIEKEYYPKRTTG